MKTEYFSRDSDYVRAGRAHGTRLLRRSKLLLSLLGVYMNSVPHSAPPPLLGASKCPDRSLGISTSVNFKKEWSYITTPHIYVYDVMPDKNKENLYCF